MKIILVRHAQKDQVTLFNKPNYGGISKKGEDQAKHFANFVKEMQPKRLITSTYKRTKQTSKVINSFLNIPQVEDKIIEETGICTYMKQILLSLFKSRAEEEHAVVKQFKKVTTLARHPALDAGSRMAKPFARANSNKKHKMTTDKCVLLVTHAGYIRILVSILTKGRWNKLKILIRPYHNLGMTVLEMKGDEIKIIEHNNIEYLPEELRSIWPI